MGELIALGIGAMIVNNIILSQFLGICPFLGVSNKSDAAFSMGVAVTFVITMAALVSALLYNLVLVPNDLTFLRTLVFILVIAALVQFVEMLLKKVSPVIYDSLGVYLPLITTNCAVLGVALIVTDNGYTYSQVLVYSLFTSLGYMLVIYTYATIRERLNNSPIPRSFEGLPIALLTAFILAMVFMGFGGLV